jgi:hypothetical protein
MVYPVTKGDGVRQKTQMTPMSCGDRRLVSQPYRSLLLRRKRIASYLDLLLCPLEDPLSLWRQVVPAQLTELFPPFFMLWLVLALATRSSCGVRLS